jgi:serine protease AprX
MPFLFFNTVLVAGFSNVDYEFKWWLSWSRDLNFNKIDDLIEEEIEKSDYVNIFVDYSDSITKYDKDRLLSLNLTISYEAKYINSLSLMNVSASLIPVISNFPHVVMIEIQPKIELNLDISSQVIKTSYSYLYSPNTTWDLGYTGRDIVVAVLDTGVDDEHEFLVGKFIAGFDCSEGAGGNGQETNPDDEDGHGTHVASIIMSSGGTAGIFKGVAPEAKLVDVKVLSSSGTNYDNQLIRGIEWVIDNKEKYNITIINLSVGSAVDDPDGTSAISRVADRAVDNGLIVVVAAGNDGPTSETLSAPALAEKVIAVAAIDDGNTVDRADDVIADYSSRGPRKDGGLKPDISAPGSDIVGAKAEQIGSASDGLVRMWGTSMAAPHVAGVCALILEANPNLSPLEIKQALLGTAEDKGSVGWDADYGWGEIDAFKALISIIGVNVGGSQNPSSNPLVFPTIEGIFSFLFQNSPFSSTMVVPSVTNYLNIIFLEVVKMGESIMKPWGFILVISCVLALLTNKIVRRSYGKI